MADDDPVNLVKIVHNHMDQSLPKSTDIEITVQSKDMSTEQLLKLADEQMTKEIKRYGR